MFAQTKPTRMIQKKIIGLIVASVLFTSAAFSQIVNKGDIIAGLNVSGQTFNQYDSFGNYNRQNTTRYANFSPYISYGIKQNLSAGAYLFIKHTSTGAFGFSKYDHDVTAGLFVKKYIPLSKRLYAFGLADLQYRTTGYTGINNFNNTKMLGLYFSGGMGYRISNRINLEMTFNNILGGGVYSSESSGTGGSQKSRQWNFNTPVNAVRANGVSIGVSVKF